MAPVDFVPKPPERRGDGKPWSAGPYVRLGERARWNAIYDIAAVHLEPIVRDSVARTDAAASIAYQVVWHDRHLNG